MTSWLSKANLGGAIYSIVLLLTGISLEVLRQGQGKSRNVDLENGTECFIASQLMDPDDSSVQLFSITCMAIAVVWAVWNFINSKFREKYSVGEYGAIDGVTEATYVTTCRMTSQIVHLSLVTFGILPVMHAAIQCMTVFALDTCWTTTGRAYHAVRLLFMTVLVLHFCALMTRNVALFSKSKYNMFMSHHYAATNLLLVFKTVTESNSFVEHFQIDFLSNLTGTSWITTVYANANFQLLSPGVHVLVLVFLSFYVDLWKTSHDSDAPKPREMDPNHAAKYTARAEVVPDWVAQITAVLFSLGIMGCVIARYNDVINIHHLLHIQLFRIVVALIIIVLAIFGILIARRRKQRNWKLDPIVTLSLIVLIGVLWDKIVNIIVCAASLYNSSTAPTEAVVLRIIEQLVLATQSLAQTILIITALRREGEFGGGKTTTIPKVTYVLALLNWALTCTYALDDHYLLSSGTASYLDLEGEIIMPQLQTATWIRSVTALSKFAYSYMSFMSFSFLAWRHNQVLIPPEIYVLYLLEKEVDLEESNMGVPTTSRDKETGELTVPVNDLLAFKDDQMMEKCPLLSTHYSKPWARVRHILSSYPSSPATLETIMKACDSVVRRTGLIREQKEVGLGMRKRPLAILPEKRSGNLVISDITESPVVKAVLLHGSHQWYALGVQLQFSNEEISWQCNNIPTCDNKLLALIMARAEYSSMDLKDIEESLLEACKKLTTPIIGAVLDEIDETSESKAPQV
jgi:hypothetical protein